MITARRLRALGHTREEIVASLNREHLFPAHRGIFFLTANPTRLARYTAATARCAPDGLTSHGPAVELWDLIPVWYGPPHVTVPRGRMREPKGIKLHWTTRPTERDKRYGVPVTTLYRTLDDYARVATPDQLKRVLRRAEYHHDIDLPLLSDQAVCAKLRTALATYVTGQGLTDSELEALFYELAHRAGLPKPILQHRTPGGRADFFFPDLDLLVEVDGYDAHRGRIAFRDDRARDRLNLIDGRTTVRYTWADVELDGDAVVAELVRLASSLSTAASTKS